MSDQPDLSLIIRVEKLLAQANDPGCTEEERDAFQTKAGALIERHRIDRSLIGGHLAADDQITTLEVGRFDGVYGRVRIDIANAVAESFDCKLFWQGYQNHRRLKVYGFRSDCEVVIALANRLLADADLRVQRVELDEHAVDMYNPDNGTFYKNRQGALQAARLRERRGFYMGYASAVRRRLRAGREDAEREAQADGVDTQSAALVLVDRKRQVNDQYRSMKIKAAGGIAGGGYSGHDAGHAAGSQVSLAHQNQVGSRKAIGR